MLKVTQNQGLTLSLEDVFGKTIDEGGQIDSTQPF